jgi:hypothetical protein
MFYEEEMMVHKYSFLKIKNGYLKMWIKCAEKGYLTSRLWNCAM